MNQQQQQQQLQQQQQEVYFEIGDEGYISPFSFGLFIDCFSKFCSIQGNLEDIAQVLEPIVEASCELAKDKHANYVVQCILQRGRLQDKIRIVEARSWFQVRFPPPEN